VGLENVFRRYRGRRNWEIKIIFVVTAVKQDIRKVHIAVGVMDYIIYVSIN
jgi:hypothetical protein